MDNNPVTVEEWQLAVDAAHAFLALDSARQYGLVTGGPQINEERCVWILTEGKKRHITPTPGAIERMIESINLSDSMMG